MKKLKRIKAEDLQVGDFLPQLGRVQSMWKADPQIITEGMKTIGVVNVTYRDMTRGTLVSTIYVHGSSIDIYFNLKSLLKQL